MQDPILITVLQKRLETIAEEMSVVLKKTSYSPNIKERADFSCAIFDQKARLIAQAEAIPVHLGSFSFVATPILKRYEGKWHSGDAIIVNSSRAEFGGTHLPDISLLSPVFFDDELRYIVATRAHHADVGGMSPGSLPPDSTEIFQEGLIIPPVKLYNKGIENEEIMEIIMENVRTPEERLGDLRAQYASLRLGENKLLELIEKENWDTKGLQEELLNISEKGTRSKLMQLPSKKAEFIDYLDSDGISSKPVAIKCVVKIDKGEIEFDFTGSDPQKEGNVNAPLSITTAACYYVVRLLTGRDIPTNEGCFRPVKIVAPEQSVVNPSKNSATSSANTETSSRIVDVIMGALATFIDFPAASQGTMNNLIIGGSSEGKAWTIYETIGGGTGANHEYDGISAIQSHMTNTLNTPVEALELAFPLKIIEYGVRKDSGGKGKFKGGDGIIREIEFLGDTTISLQTERRKIAPWGIKGGSDGAMGKNEIRIAGKWKNIGGRSKAKVNRGDRLRINTPGGGGYGKYSEHKD